MRKVICNTLFVAAAAIMFTSCSGDEEVKDDQFCACLSATEDLNAVSSKLMEGGITEESRIEVKELRAKKDKLCKDYATLSGEENRKKMELCKGKPE